MVNIAMMEEEKKNEVKKKDKQIIEEIEKVIKKTSEEVKVDVEKLNETYPQVGYSYKGANIEPSEEDKQNLNIVIIGHVDSGKSTLTGHLLYELGLVTQKQMRENTKRAEEYNKESFEFAFVMDETEEEQKRGVTIDVTTRYF